MKRMALRKLNVQLGLNTQGFSSGLKSAGKDLKDFNKDIKSADKGAASLSSGIGKLTKSAAKIAAATITIKALTRATKAAFNAYLVFESSMMRSHDVFRDSNKYIKYFAENTAKAFGMSESAAYQYAATYGNLFKAVTKDTEENAKVTIAMLKASAVIASKTGRTTEDVMERLRSGILGNTEAIEDLGIYAQVGMLKTSEAFKKIANGKSWEQLTFQQQQQIRILSYLEQAHSQFGDTVANTSAFSLQTLAGAFKNLTSYAGAFVNAGLQPIIRGLTRLVTWATAGIKALASLFGLELKFADTGATEAATAAQDDLTDAVEKTAKAKRGLAAFDKINQISSSSGGSSGGGGVSAGAGGGVFDGIAMPEFEEADTSWMDKYESRFEQFKKIFDFTGLKTSWENFKSALTPISEKIGNGAKWLYDNVFVPFAAWTVNDAAPVFLDMVSAAAEVLNTVIEIAKPQFKWIWDTFLQPLAKWSGEYIVEQMTRVTNTLKKFSDWASNNRNTVELMSELILGYFAGLWIYNTAKPIIAFLASANKGFTVLGGGLSIAGAGAFLASAGFGLLSAGVVALAMNWSKMNGLEKTIGVLGLVAIAAAGAAAAVGALQSAWSLGIAAAAIVAGTAAIAYAVHAAGKRATAAYNSFSSTGTTSSSGRMHGGAGAAQAFATGGIVTSPTYALIGEAGSEAVMPLERNTGWIDQLASKLNSKDGGGDIYLTEHIYLDSGELINSFTKKINRESRKNNKPILAV